MAKNTKNPFIGLNEIEGINLLKLVKEDEETKLSFLPVKDRVSWFRTKYPDAPILTRIESVTETHVVAVAEVYLRQEDVRPLSTARHAISFADPVFGGEKAYSSAETCAIGRALAFAGFGCQINSNELDTPLIDAGFVKTESLEDIVEDEPKPKKVLSVLDKVERQYQSMNSVKAAGMMIPAGKFMNLTVKEAFVKCKEKSLDPNVEFEPYVNPESEENNAVLVAAAVRFCLEKYNEQQEKNKKEK